MNYIHLLTVCVCVCGGDKQTERMGGDQKVSCLSFPFFSTIWVLGIELGLSSMGDCDPAQWHQFGPLTLAASQCVSVHLGPNWFPLFQFLTQPGTSLPTC